MALCRSYSEAQQNGPAAPDAQLADIVRYMRTHCSTVTLAELSDVSRYSTAHLSRIIKGGPGKGFRDLLKDRKPEGACTSSMSAI